MRIRPQSDWFRKGIWSTPAPRMSAEMRRLCRWMTEEEEGDRAAGYARSAYRKRKSHNAEEA